MDCVNVLIHFGEAKSKEVIQILCQNRSLHEFVHSGYTRALQSPDHVDRAASLRTPASVYIELLAGMCRASDVATDELVAKGVVRELTTSVKQDPLIFGKEVNSAVVCLLHILLAQNGKHLKIDENEDLIPGICFY